MLQAERVPAIGRGPASAFWPARLEAPCPAASRRAIWGDEYEEIRFAATRRDAACV